MQTAPLVVKDKYFDGSTEAQLDSPGLIGVVAGDKVQAQAKAQFQDLLAGEGKQVKVKLNLDGADAGNYQLAQNLVEILGRIKGLDSQGQTAGLVVKTQGGNATSGASGVGNGGGNGGGNGVGAGAGVGAAAGAQGAIALPATGPAPSLLALADGAGTAGRGASALAVDGSQQLLRNGGQVSLSLAGNAPTETVQNVLPLFRDGGANGGLDRLGHYLVQDQGDSLSLMPRSLAEAELPKLDSQAVSARAETLLDLGQGETASMTLELLANGTLRAAMPPQAAQLGAEVLSAHGLSTLKRKAGVPVDQVRNIVLRFDAKR
ncbi:hypothetical protein DBR47_20545 [Paucibacter sp. KBW04]|nr:hypothetical protein DBR47_20545 [Paucibacter sp. KBW04]